MTVSPKLQLQQLVQLQKIDDQIFEHKKALADIPIQLDSARAELEEKKNILKVVTEEIETLQKQRKDLELEVQGENDHMAKAKNISAQLDTVILKRYEKISNSRDGRAVAGLRENICQGCFQQVLPQMVIEVKVAEKIHQCGGCMRFLFWDEVSETTVPK